MKKQRIPYKDFFLLALFVFSVFPESVQAGELSFTVVSNPVLGDTATIIEVRIDTQNVPVNVVEGTIQIENTNNSVTDVHVETGGSLLTLWPVKPVYNPDTKSISFTGGSRTNLSGKGLLLRLRIFSSSAETIHLSWANGTMYIGDGKASLEPVAKHSISVAVEKGTPNPINPSSADSIPPMIDQVEIGQDDEVYDGKKFIHITSTDNKSGIDRIEVTENGIVTEATNDTYVFQNQENDPELLVTAYDKAGNSMSLKYPQKNKWGLYILFLLLLLLMYSYIHHVRSKKII